MASPGFPAAVRSGRVCFLWQGGSHRTAPAGLCSALRFGAVCSLLQAASVSQSDLRMITRVPSSALSEHTTAVGPCGRRCRHTVSPYVCSLSSGRILSFQSNYLTCSRSRVQDTWGHGGPASWLRKPSGLRVSVLSHCGRSRRWPARQCKPVKPASQDPSERGQRHHACFLSDGRGSASVRVLQRKTGNAPSWGELLTSSLPR